MSFNYSENWLPPKKVLKKPELTGRIVTWLIELSKFNLQFEPLGPIKEQYLANFIVVLPPTGDNNEGGWTLNVDGASSSKDNGSSVTFKGLDNISIQ